MPWFFATMKLFFSAFPTHFAVNSSVPPNCYMRRFFQNRGFVGDCYLWTPDKTTGITGLERDIRRISANPHEKGDAMAIEVTRARGDTPGCDEVVHFNNAGAALMPKPVMDAVLRHLNLESRIGGYEAAALGMQAIERVYDAAAEMLGCTNTEIAVVENATRAWDMVFYSIPYRPGDRILTSVSEYASNFIAYLQIAKKTGARVEVIPNDEYGQISVEALRNAIDGDVKLISLTHVPTNGGLVNPAEEVGKVAREAGVLYLLDACQSVGQMPLNVKKLGCHMLSGTGRKFLRGPRGTGLLYVDKEILQMLEPPFLDLRAAHWRSGDRYEIRPDAKRFETWEGYMAGRVGLGVAIDYALKWGLEAIRERVSSVAGELRTRLGEMPRVIVRDRGRIQCGIVSFSVDGQLPQTIQRGLAERNINVSVSPAEYTLLDMEQRGLQAGLVRASVHYYNTSEEVDFFCQTLASLIGRYEGSVVK